MRREIIENYVRKDVCLILVGQTIKDGVAFRIDSIGEEEIAVTSIDGEVRGHIEMEMITAIFETVEK